MAEPEATMSQTSLLADAPENSEPPKTPEAPEPQEAQASEPAPSAEPKRGRGRPAGAKDRAPRAKPKVRVEPIPTPKAPAPAPAGDLPGRAPPVVEHVEARPPSPEPPSPRTLFRQTSAHLLNLREVMNHQKRTSAARGTRAACTPGRSSERFPFICPRIQYK